MDNQWLDLLQQIFNVCIIPLLGVLTAFIVKYVNAKSAEMSAQTDDALMQKYIKMLSDTITACVIATNQTYVNALKDQNAFELEAQKAAFEMTKNAVMEILSVDAKEYLNNAFGDLETYINNMIEAEVNKAKTVNAVVVESVSEDGQLTAAVCRAAAICKTTAIR